MTLDVSSKYHSIRSYNHLRIISSNKHTLSIEHPLKTHFFNIMNLAWMYSIYEYWDQSSSVWFTYRLIGCLVHVCRPRASLHRHWRPSPASPHVQGPTGKRTKVARAHRDLRTTTQETNTWIETYEPTLIWSRQFRIPYILFILVWHFPQSLSLYF